MLAILIKIAKMDGQIDGVVPHLVDEGLLILQYADNNILFLEHDLEKAKKTLSYSYVLLKSFQALK
jgi:hypothetical protein